MAKDFIFRIKKGETLPPRDPNGTRILFDESTKEFYLLDNGGNKTKANPGGGAGEQGPQGKQGEPGPQGDQGRPWTARRAWT